MKLGPKTPPEMAQAPIATPRFGVGIASCDLCKECSIASEAGPATSRISALRGVGVVKKPSALLHDGSKPPRGESLDAATGCPIR